MTAHSQYPIENSAFDHNFADAGIPNCHEKLWEDAQTDRADGAHDPHDNVIIAGAGPVAERPPVENLFNTVVPVADMPHDQRTAAVQAAWDRARTSGAAADQSALCASLVRHFANIGRIEPASRESRLLEEIASGRGGEQAAFTSAIILLRHGRTLTQIAAAHIVVTRIAVSCADRPLKAEATELYDTLRQKAENGKNKGDQHDRLLVAVMQATVLRFTPRPERK